ncbi:adenylylsulfate reductase subunit alpha [Clostridia bacterium]|nr:adenylylsulfate reductase subunit alpha [Clostridia bacterium]
MGRFNVKRIETDFLIIGGGTAGCYAALTLREKSPVAKIIIAEKADIKRSGCLAAGVNAINAYILPGHTPREYADSARADAEDIVRGDLLLSMAERLNGTVAKLESLGLAVLKDENGNYAGRGSFNIKINGENIKPILADAVSKLPNITIMNRLNVFKYIVCGGKIRGAFAFSIDDSVLYAISAKAVICASGGASGLYKSNNPGFSRHKMWYPPFNTGAGFAMGIESGAEMTTFEMRFIALRCKDTIAPTGTLALGVGAKQINSLGEVYETKYGVSTSQRLHGTVAEESEGRGPCYLRTVGITKEQDEDLQKAYLNMAPSQTLKWIESGEFPSGKNVEICGSEPYIVGGHTASGYWVDVDRETTIKGLYAAGDVAGGCPKKFVTGAFAEGEIAAKSALKYLTDDSPTITDDEIAVTKGELERIFINVSDYTADSLEEEMQSVMDEYAGGIGQHYRYNDRSLKIADDKIKEIQQKADELGAKTMRELLYIFELRERLILCRSVIAHLAARKETRWHSFAENTDHPDKSGDFDVYINSKLENGEIKVFTRELVKE